MNGVPTHDSNCREHKSRCIIWYKFMGGVGGLTTVIKLLTLQG